MFVWLINLLVGCVCVSLFVCVFGCVCVCVLQCLFVCKCLFVEFVVFVSVVGLGGCLPVWLFNC